MPLAPSFYPNHLDIIHGTGRFATLRNILTAAAMSGGVAADLLQQVQRLFVDGRDVL